MAGTEDTIKRIIEEALPDKYLFMEWDTHDEVMLIHDLTAEEPMIVKIPHEKLLSVATFLLQALGNFK